MKAIVNTRSDTLEMRELPLPDPAEGQVRIRTAACGICSTELEFILTGSRTGFPSVLGHEWSGTVDATGPGVAPDLMGRPCVAENLLSDGGEVGFEHPGGYAEFFLTEAANLHALPQEYPLANATLIEPLAVCVRAMRRLRLENKDRVLILGDGPIGLIMVRMLRQSGVREICMMGGRLKRLALAREFGASSTINYHEMDCAPGKGIDKKLAGGFPNVILAASSLDAARMSLEAAAPEGKMIQLASGIPPQTDFSWEQVLLRETEIIGSNASAGAWGEALRLAVEDRLPLDRLISHRFPVSEYQEAFRKAHGAGEAVKVVLEWPGFDR